MRATFLPATFLGALLFLLIASSPASAAHPCASIQVDQGVGAKVATVGVGCRVGREVAATYFERVRGEDHWDGKTRDGSIFYSVKGFRCLTGLAGSQMFCRRHNRWIFASTNPGDRPATWT
jgi:hypothetical protein